MLNTYFENIINNCVNKSQVKYYKLPNYYLSYAVFIYLHTRAQNFKSIDNNDINWYCNYKVIKTLSIIKIIL